MSHEEEFFSRFQLNFDRNFQFLQDTLNIKEVPAFEFGFQFPSFVRSKREHSVQFNARTQREIASGEC